MTYKAWYGKGWKAGGGRVTACSWPTCIIWSRACLWLEVTAEELKINDFRHFQIILDELYEIHNRLPKSKLQNCTNAYNLTWTFFTRRDFVSHESHKSWCQLDLWNSYAAPSWLYKFTQSHTKTQLRKNKQSLWSWNSGWLSISFPGTAWAPSLVKLKYYCLCMLLFQLAEVGQICDGCRLVLLGCTPSGCPPFMLSCPSQAL